MQSTKHPQRDRVTQSAEDRDLVQAVSLGDVVSNRQYADYENRDAEAAHGEHDAIAFEK
jgi:hypothetical protein